MISRLPVDSQQTPSGLQLGLNLESSFRELIWRAFLESPFKELLWKLIIHGFHKSDSQQTPNKLPTGSQQTWTSSKFGDFIWRAYAESSNRGHLMNWFSCLQIICQRITYAQYACFDSPEFWESVGSPIVFPKEHSKWALQIRFQMRSPNRELKEVCWEPVWSLLRVRWESYMIPLGVQWSLQMGSPNRIFQWSLKKKQVEGFLGVRWEPV